MENHVQADACSHPDEQIDPIRWIKGSLLRLSEKGEAAENVRFPDLDSSSQQCLADGLPVDVVVADHVVSGQNLTFGRDQRPGEKDQAEAKKE